MIMEKKSKMVAKKPENFITYFYDWPVRIKTAECSCIGPLLPMRVTFGVLKQTKRQILSECVHSVGFRWPKTTILLPYMFAAHKYNEKP